MNVRISDLAIATVINLVASVPALALTNANYDVLNLGSNVSLNSTTPSVAHFAPSGPSNTGTADITSLATYGVLKDGTSLTTTGVGSITVNGNTDEAFDAITFQNATLTGQTGFVTARIYYNWTIGSSATGSLASANASVNLAFSLNGYAVAATEKRSVGCSFSGVCSAVAQPLLISGFVVNSTPYGYIDGRFGFVFGQSAQTSFVINEVLNGKSGVDGASAAFVDAAHSIYWGGVLGVTDSAGNAVGYTLTSDSGTNYAQSFAPAAMVPEPSSALMVCFGLVGVGLGACQRRRNRA